MEKNEETEKNGGKGGHENVGSKDCIEEVEEMVKRRLIEKKKELIKAKE